MIHSLANRITIVAVKKELISSEKFNQCVYCLEKSFLKLSFALGLLILAIITECHIEIICFLLGFLPLRSTLGGWHAKHAWMCMLLSILTIYFICCALRAYVYSTANIVIVLLMPIVLLTASTAKPIYPKQLHFNTQVQKANTCRKNRLLLILSAIQVFCLVTHHVHPIAYLNLGIGVALVTLLIEQIIQYFKGDNT